MLLNMTTFHIITLFPEAIEGYINSSILGRAQKENLIVVKYYNPRDFTDKKGKTQTYAERRVDNKPYGGGPGMVIEAMPVIRAIEAAIKSKTLNSKHETLNKFKTLNPKSKFTIPPSSLKLRRAGKSKILFFSPSGKQFTNKIAESFKKYSDIILVCGRYEGIDARVKKAFPMIEISVGPYVLTGGEIPAMVVIDSITRRIDGVLGDAMSIEEERVASKDVYTRPEIIKFKGKSYKVPKILLGGHHQKIEDWKKSRKVI